MRHTRAAVIERTTREFDELDSLVAGLQSADWERLVLRPETRDPWTVKDALVHIVYWKAHSARVFRGEKREPALRGLDVPANQPEAWFSLREHAAHWPADFDGHSAGHRRKDLVRALE